MYKNLSYLDKFMSLNILLFWLHLFYVMSYITR